MNRTLFLMSGLGLGAGLMYMLDPEKGGRRRASAQEQLAAYRRRTDDFLDQATHTIGRQARDLLPQARLPFRRQQPGAGEKLLARVEQLGVSRGLCMLGCAALGAGVMYMLDPSGGPRRRSRMRDKSQSYWHRAEELLDKTVHDVRQLTRGAETSAEAEGSDEPSDTVLKTRVQAQLSHTLSQAGAIQVQAQQGRVTLRGPIAAHEVEQLLATVKSVAGVSEVVNQLDVRNRPERPSNVQGRNAAR